MEQVNIEEVALILFFLNKEKYSKYYSYIIKLNLEAETKKFLETIREYFEDNSSTEECTVEEFLTYFAVKHPVLRKRTGYANFLTKLGSITINSDILEENLNHFLEKYFASEVILCLTDVLDGENFDVLECKATELIEEFSKNKLQLQRDEDELFVNDSLLSLLEEEDNKPGLRWRLNCLNEDIGELRGCSLGHVYARVDTGKTSFLFSETTHMAEQCSGDEIILWCNNEESGKKLKKRLYQAVLNATTEQLVEYKDSAEETFIRQGGHRVKIYDDAGLSIEAIDRLLSDFDVRLLVIDQGDKVHFRGEGNYSTVDRLKILYGKFRELAKKYDVPIITVGQASAQAEGKKWLQMSWMDNSKCLGKGEKVFMADGSIKVVEDIVVGDKVLNIFSEPETVVKTATGTEEMYRIKAKNYSYVCNASHILTLKARHQYNGIAKDTVIDVTVKDYLMWSKTKQRVFKQYLPKALEFTNPQQLSIAPYFMGLWLGDGSKNSSELTVADSEIEEYLHEYATSLGLQLTINSIHDNWKNIHLSSGCPGKSNVLLSNLKRLGVVNNKFIPEVFLTASVSDRYSLLAGLLDSDGSLCKRISYEYFEWSSSRRILLDGMCRLLASLGIRYSWRTKTINAIPYYYVYICDNLSKIPTRVARKQSSFVPRLRKDTISFTVEPLGVGEYYGFTLNGTGLFTQLSGVCLHNTGKPAELDYAIGIGMDEDDVANGITWLRYISICKNKMKQGNHGQYAVRFDSQRARYVDNPRKSK